MANLASVLKAEIRRLARSESRSEVATLKKQSAQYRRDIAALKRQVDKQAKRVAFLEKQEQRRGHTVPSEEVADSARFSPKGLRSHRKRLGLSADDFGRLIGVSGQSVYAWEQGRTRPRAAQLAKIVEARQLGKREAEHRLARMGG